MSDDTASTRTPKRGPLHALNGPAPTPAIDRGGVGAGATTQLPGPKCYEQASGEDTNPARQPDLLICHKGSYGT